MDGQKDAETIRADAIRETVGWMYAELCSRTDRGEDIREAELPEIGEKAVRELGADREIGSPDTVEQLIHRLMRTADIQDAPKVTQRHGPHCLATIAIGKDHSATIEMTDDALSALCSRVGADLGAAEGRGAE